MESKHEDTKNSSGSNVYKPSSMPRSIQMGTGHVTAHNTASIPSRAPDILSGVSQSQSSSDGSMVSMETVLTPATSDLSDMRDIIRDLGERPGALGQPLIGHHPGEVKQPRWSVDNPYLHTSPRGPLYLGQNMRPDQQYPLLQVLGAPHRGRPGPAHSQVSGEGAVISDRDSMAEMLSKLKGKVNDEDDEEDISEELENAFQSLNLSTQRWDDPGTQI